MKTLKYHKHRMNRTCEYHFLSVRLSKLLSVLCSNFCHLNIISNGESTASVLHNATLLTVSCSLPWWLHGVCNLVDLTAPGYCSTKLGPLYQIVHLYMYIA